MGVVRRRFAWSSTSVVFVVVWARVSVAQAQEPPPTPEPTPAVEPPAKVEPFASEVRVRAKPRTDRQLSSAEAVEIVDTSRARQSSADMGDLASRSIGVGVQRTAGLGSGARISLNGLTDDQIRFFLDGVPLDFMGFGGGLANVPVNLIASMEIYRGVVPIRFGADALGGAINLVTDQGRKGTHAGASYQVGSFGTYRGTAHGRHRFDRTGAFASVTSFADRTENSYPVIVFVPDEVGTSRPRRVRRFHDGYAAYGVNVEAGWVDRPWAKRLTLKLFTTGFDKDVQHNVNMTSPYGEVEFGESVFGGLVHYEKQDFLVDKLRVDALGGYSRRTLRTLDVSQFAYDWYGNRIAERVLPLGEFGGPLSDVTRWEDRYLARLNASYSIADGHIVRLGISPSVTQRTGENARWASPEALDPTRAQQGISTLVSGVEYQLDALEQKLENIAFAKDYLYGSNAQSLVTSDRFEERSKSIHTLGAGDALRYRVAKPLWAKASYEFATRLPRPDEVFGDGLLVRTNLDLKQETSHNANLSLAVDVKESRTGAWRGEVGTFLRDADDLIIFLPSPSGVATYANLSRVRSRGAQGRVGWTSPGDYLWLDVNGTWLDLRNESDTAIFAPYKGERVPNRPWLWANTSARLQVSKVMSIEDELSATWNMRYVHSFFPSWESLGNPESKTIVPTQLVHSFQVAYVVRSFVTVTSALEAQNVFDRRVYDVVGVQKPGRAFYFKGTLEY